MSNAVRARGLSRRVRPSAPRRPGPGRRALVTLELVTGLVCFEAAELAWLGFQPLEAVFALVGVTVIGLAWRMPRSQP